MTSPTMPAAVTGLTADQVLDQMLVARALELTRDPLDRERTLSDLVSIAGGRVEPLERARAYFQRRLSRRSDDFEATHGLRMVAGALVQIAQSVRKPPPARRRRRPWR